jgi:lysophospholipase L1-like esterase
MATKMNDRRFNILIRDGITPDKLPGTFKWLKNDLEQRYDLSSKEHRAYWDENQFSYDLNSYGFRCDEFEENQESILFLGCSNTLGYGMPKEKSWTHLVAQSLGLKEYNLGVGGGSLDCAFKLYNAWQPIIKAKHTVLLIPPAPRFEIFANGLYHTIGSWIKLNPGHMGFTSSVVENYVDMLTNDEYMQTLKDRNCHAIKNLARETNSNLIIKDSADVSNNENEIKGRDGTHPGPAWHERLAKMVLGEFK